MTVDGINPAWLGVSQPADRGWVATVERFMVQCTYRGGCYLILIDSVHFMLGANVKNSQMSCASSVMSTDTLHPKSSSYLGIRVFHFTHFFGFSPRPHKETINPLDMLSYLRRIETVDHGGFTWFYFTELSPTFSVAVIAGWNE